MSDLRLDMSGLDRICPVTRNFAQRKRRLGDKMMRLGLDKLTISKLNNMELKEITGITRSNLNFRIQI
jgi:DNA-binding Xre family transcriptional regulator